MPCDVSSLGEVTVATEFSGVSTLAAGVAAAVAFGATTVVVASTSGLAATGAVVVTVDTAT